MTISSSGQPSGSVCVSAVHRPRPRVVVIDLTGELDIATTPSVGACIDEVAAEGIEHLVLDVRDVSFMASSGVGLLFGLLNRDGIAAVHLVGVHRNDQVRRVLDVSGLRLLFPDHGSVEDALA